MFVALISTIMSAFSDVFWKKSLSYWVRPKAQSLASYPIWLVIVVYFFYIGFDTSSFNILAVLAVLAILIIDVIKEPVIQQVYREEKMSVIMPYLNLNKIFIIIASFFIFQDVSLISFCIIIFTVLVIILSSIDLKNKKLPRNFSKILFNEVGRTIWTLWSGWLILNYSEILYFNLYAVIWFIVVGYFALKTWQIHDLKTVPWQYWKYRIIGALGWLSWFLSLVVIKELWLSLSILLWFFGIWITLFVSYLFLKDTPSKKDITLTIVVAVLIGIWFYFK